MNKNKTSLGLNIARLRKIKNMTQDALSQKLNISTQAISKWENGQSIPDTTMLPLIASVLNTSIDSLMNHTPNYITIPHYEEYYRNNDFYWGTTPNPLALNILNFIYPTKPLKLLEIGCGEGRDAIFFARNGFEVTAFDISETGINKAKQIAKKAGLNINFFQSDLKNFQPTETYDVIYSSGVLHHITDEYKKELFKYYKDNTAINGFNIFNVFVTKPYIEIPPDSDGDDNTWSSGELLQIYSDWKTIYFKEEEINCNSNNIHHKHCLNTIISQKYTL